MPRQRGEGGGFKTDPDQTDPNIEAPVEEAEISTAPGANITSPDGNVRPTKAFANPDITAAGAVMVEKQSAPTIVTPDALRAKAGIAPPTELATAPEESREDEFGLPMVSRAEARAASGLLDPADREGEPPEEEMEKIDMFAGDVYPPAELQVARSSTTDREMAVPPQAPDREDVPLATSRPEMPIEEVDDQAIIMERPNLEVVEAKEGEELLDFLDEETMKKIGEALIRSGQATAAEVPGLMEKLSSANRDVARATLDVVRTLLGEKFDYVVGKVILPPGVSSLAELREIQHLAREAMNPKPSPVYEEPALPRSVSDVRVTGLSGEAARRALAARAGISSPGEPPGPPPKKNWLDRFKFWKK